MWSLRFDVSIFAVGMLLFCAGGVSGQATSTRSGQAYPYKPIRIVTNTIGGSGDFVARLVAEGIAGGLGQPVIVENRPPNVIAEIVSKAPPDGYTLLVAGGTFLFSPLLGSVSYDPVKDFSPITMVDKSPLILVVHPSVAANSVKELIALAKAKSGVLNYGSAGIGGSSHLAAELFKSMANVNIVRIVYAGGGLMITGLLGGEVQIYFSSPTAGIPLIKSGKLRALAITSTEPSALAPGLPTIAATGIPGYEFISIDTMAAPAKTPATTIKRLNQEIVRVLNQADLKEKFLKAGTEAAPTSPEELAAKIKSEIVKWSKVIKDAGIKAD